MQSAIYPLVRHSISLYGNAIDYDLFSKTVDLGARMNFDLLTLVAKGLRVQGSCVAPRSVYHKMARFSAAQGIKPMVEEFPMTEKGIENAFEALAKGTLRYRAVLVAQ